MEKDFNLMKEEMIKLKETQIEMQKEDIGMKKDIEYIKETMDNFIECADKKYASKLTERIVYAIAGLILLSFFGFLIKLAF